MSRFLFVVAPWVGHVHRMRPYAEELAERGHEVAWAAHRGIVAHVLPAGQPVFALPDEPAREAVAENRRHALQSRFAPAITAGSLDAVGVPLARSMRPGVEAALAELEPDCVVTDVIALAGGIAARRHGVPWATSAQPAHLAHRAIRDAAPLVEFARRMLAPIQREAGLEPLEWPTWSPSLVLVNSVRELVGDILLDPQVRLVGATYERARAEVPFPWEELGGRPLVYASLGTVAEHLGRRFFGELGRALADEPVQAVVAADPGLVEDPPPNMLVRPFVPQLELLRRAAAVVSHAGGNTVAEALAHGRPLVVAPIAYDQPFNAERVEATGAGVRVRFARSRATSLRDAIRRVLDDPSFARNAARIGAALRGAGGATTAADHLEELAAASSRAAGTPTV